MQTATTTAPSTPPQTAGKTSAGTPAGTSGTSASLSPDFQTFLTMLTTQLRNQDPLNPVQGSDFAVQLATFSNVEQQVRTNDLLAGLGDRVGLMGLGQLAGWIGMQASSNAAVEFDGTPINLDVSPAQAADTVQLVVTNAQGEEVQRSPIPTQSGQITWAGTDAAGQPLPPGRYQVSTESFANGTLLASTPAQWQGRITEARVENGQTVLHLDTGQTLAAGDVLALSSPPTA